MNMLNSRRRFLKVSASLSCYLILGFDSVGKLSLAFAKNYGQLTISPFLKLSPKGELTVIVKHCEFGQGIITALLTLVAEEFDYPIERLKYEFAGANEKLYSNQFLLSQITGSSTSLPDCFEQYRKVGAAARELLSIAASQIWKVKKANIKLIGDQVTDGVNHLNVEALFPIIEKLELPKNPKLKAPADFKLIGKNRIKRKENLSKINGKAQYAMDANLPEQIYVTIKKPQKFGARVSSFDESEAVKLPGLTKVLMLPDRSGVAIYGQSTWHVFQAKKAIKVIWDNSDAEVRSSDKIQAELIDKVNTKPRFVIHHPPSKIHQPSLKPSVKVIEKIFYFPYLAHAPMEPLSCILSPSKDGIELFDGCQDVSFSVDQLVQVLDIPKEKIKLNNFLIGGSFGRRFGDHVKDVAVAFKMLDGKQPIKLVQTREDDIQGGYYRPAVAHRVKVHLDSSNMIVKWEHQVATQSICANGAYLIMAGDNKLVSVNDNKPDVSSIDGTYNTLYSIPKMSTGLTNFYSQIPVHTWRSVSNSHTTFVMESMMDILALQAKKDPIDFRKQYLDYSKVPEQRLLNVLSIVESMSNWNSPRKKKQFKGIAAHRSNNTFVAIVVELFQKDTNLFQIKNVFCAVDCGLPVNPDLIKSQIEGGIGYGAGHIMRAEITLKNGEVEQSNFYNYPSLLISDIHDISVHIVPSTLSPTGVGETGVPPIGPAIANAIAQSGLRITHLPLEKNGVKFA